jgi:SAM-dependent methyltransferase
MATLEQAFQFPVPLVCPVCQASLSTVGSCYCGENTKLEMWNGLPRTLFGQNYWGECSKEKMLEILETMGNVHWIEALKKVVPDEPVRRHLLTQIGPDFLYGMPWDKIRTVLDIGSGMGFMTAPMARFAENIVAVEAVPERALFLARRARQDGLNNVHVVIGSGTALPFPPASFDLITMNGVFEYIGLWGTGDPQQLQEKFLKTVLKLLKPNGYLYVGIETRYALRAFLGGRDHSGLAFTSVMPRWLANYYCKLRSVPFYGGDRVLSKYRTYTYTPAQYKQMFRRVGFPAVEVYGLHDGYNRQVAIYPLQDYFARQVTRNIVDPPASFRGASRRAIANNRLCYKTLENEVVVFGCKNAGAVRLSWAGIKCSGAITTINTSRKVNLLLFEEDEPRWIAQASKNRQDQDRFDKEYRFLQTLEAILGQNESDLRWPKPCGEQVWHQLHFYLLEFQKGVPLSRLLLPWFHRGRRVNELMPRLVQSYINLTERMTGRLRGVITDEEREAFIAPLEKVCFDDAKIGRQVYTACEVFRARNWPMQVVHGDLSFSNTLLCDTGRLVLIDWENTSMAGLAGIDLMRLLGDGWFESEHLPDQDRSDFMAGLRQVVSRGLRQLQIEPIDFPHITALFLSHQVYFNRVRGGQVASFEKAFLQGVFDLTGFE